MPDQVILGILPQFDFRFSIVDLTDTARQAVTLHKLNSEMSIFLAKTMMGALFLSEMTKNRQRVSIQWKDETEKSVLAYSDRYGKMKAVAYGHALDIGDVRNEFILGQGIMKVIRWEVDSNLYQSFTNLIEDTFEINLHKYLTESEQVKTIVYMEVETTVNDVNPFYSKGLMFQALPEATEEGLSFLKSIVAPIAAKAKFWKLGIEEMRLELAAAIGSQLLVLSTEKPGFHCDCSRYKVSEVIASLGHKEAESILNEYGYVEIICEFCKSAYRFDPSEIENLFPNE